MSEIDITSLCCVKRGPGGAAGDIWLHRLADVKDYNLCHANIPSYGPRMFQNRDRIFRHDGPDKVNTIGVWRWTAEPNLNDKNKDYVTSYFQPDEHPIRLVNVRPYCGKDIEGLGRALKSGQVRTDPFICDTLFCFRRSASQYVGLHCKIGDFYFEHGVVKLDDSINTLPVYVITGNEILNVNVEDGRLLFLRCLNLGQPTGNIFIGDVNAVIRDVLLKRLSWKQFSAAGMGSRTDYKVCRDFIGSIRIETLVEDIAERVHSTPDQVTSLIEKFIENANQMLKPDDIDESVFARLVLNNDVLRSRHEQMFEEELRNLHAKQIVAAQEEANKAIGVINAGVEQAKKHADTIQKDVEIAIQQKEKLSCEIRTSEEKLDKISEEMAQYEALGTETVNAVRAQIVDLQKNAAGLIARHAIFLPQQFGTPLVSQQPTAHATWTYTAGFDATSDPRYADHIEKCQNYADTLDILTDNLLTAGVRQDAADTLATFLYSAYINKAHLLLAGPNAKEISNAFALAVTGRSAGAVACYGERNESLFSVVADDVIVTVENPFSPDWLASLPCLAGATNRGDRMFWWVHPFAEDLSIEPFGLFNYVLPVLTECFVDHLSSEENMLLGIRASDYEDYQRNGAVSTQSARMSPIKKLKLPHILANRLQAVIGDAKAMQNSTNGDFECLFGVLPFAVIANNNDLLKEVIHNEGLSAFVKDELKRYTTDE